MEPLDSLLGQRVEELSIIEALRAVEPGRDRIIVRRDEVAVVDLLGEAGKMQTPILNKAREALVRDADVFHNHPLSSSGRGPDRSFSADDFYFARRLSPARMVAVAQTVWFEVVRPIGGWRRGLVTGAEWERDYRGFLALEIQQGRSVAEARHEACVRLCWTRRILYERRELR